MKIGKIAAAVMAAALVACFFSRDARAQTVDQERAAEDLHDAEAAAKRHRDELMKIPHVRVVTGEVDGQNEAAILVEVDEQKNVDQVTRELPSQIEGFPVEVDEDESALESNDISDAGHWNGAASTPTPSVSRKGNNYHTLLNQPAPATDTDAPQ